MKASVASATGGQRYRLTYKVAGDIDELGGEDGKHYKEALVTSLRMLRNFLHKRGFALPNGKAQTAIRLAFGESIQNAFRHGIPGTEAIVDIKITRNSYIFYVIERFAVEGKKLKDHCLPDDLFSERRRGMCVVYEFLPDFFYHYDGKVKVSFRPEARKQKSTEGCWFTRLSASIN